MNVWRGHVEAAVSVVLVAVGCVLWAVAWNATADVDFLFYVLGTPLLIAGLTLGAFAHVHWMTADERDYWRNERKG